MTDAPAPAQPANPDVFTVQAVDQATKKPVTLQVTRNLHIKSQQDAEKHVADMAKSIGGTHPGLEVVPAVVTNTDPATAG